MENEVLQLLKIQGSGNPADMLTKSANKYTEVVLGFIGFQAWRKEMLVTMMVFFVAMTEDLWRMLAKWKIFEYVDPIPQSINRIRGA